MAARLNELPTGELQTGELQTGELQTGDIPGGNMTGGNMTGGNMTGGNMTGGDVTGGPGAMTRRSAVLAIALGSLGACTSPNPTLYTLASVPGEALSGAPKTIELRAISLARYLERSQIVRSSDDYRLDVLSNEWWGEPLDSMMGRIIQQNLTQRLPGATVFSENGAISSVPEATLGVGVQRMDLNRGGQVLLIGQLSVSRRGTTARTVTLEVRPASSSTPDLVAAMSTAIGQLTDQAAMMLTAR